MMSPKDEAYFSDLLKKLRSDLCAKLPEVDDPTIFRSACQSVQDAQGTFDAATKARDHASEDHKEEAQDAMDAAEKALAAACEVALVAATPLIRNYLPTLDSDSLDDDLLKCSVIFEATPKGLAEYCARGQEQDELVGRLLGDSELMQKFLKAGGVRAGCYGDAMEIYSKLLPETQDDALFRKLALAVSIELADGSLKEFDTDIVVDPVARFQHYKEAHLRGELDPAFVTFSAFELRHVINSDAPNDQLAWGREMLRNHRPDQVIMDNYDWRYVMSVRTDVPYKHPEWWDTPRTYQMIISNGGECGPRAWFGRFILRSFGIPVWGVRQPGHAALTHWSLKGWVVNLGATWKFCTWEGRWGPDFLLETQARSRGEKSYMRVLRLEWIANVMGEPPLDAGKCIVNPDSLWRSLALTQKKILSAQQLAQPIIIPQLRVSTKRCKPPAQYYDDALIIVEATSCQKPDKSTNNVIFMKSFMGGMQMHHQGDDTVEYTFDMQESGTYSMTVLLVTVHRDCEKMPLLVSFESGDTTSLSKITIPYTTGMFRETEPVTVELQKGTNMMSFTREAPNYGFTLKCFLFRPIST
jgi:hypothetical protein